MKTPAMNTRDTTNRFRVAGMCCAAEQSEIRHAVEGVAGVRGMTFQAGQRTLAIDGPAEAVQRAVAAIRRAGFDPQPVAVAAALQHTGEHASHADAHDHDAAAARCRR